MHWHLLPPQSPEECRFRGPVESAASGEQAVCGVVRTTLPEVDVQACRASRATCLACCLAAPATPTTWNPVVSSLIYHAASHLAKMPNARPDTLARARAAQTVALARMDVVAPAPKQAPRSVGHFERLRDLIPRPARRHPQPIRKWAVGVTTAPRAQPTLDVCLDHLTRAGWPTPHLFMDAAVRVPQRHGHLPGTLRSPVTGAWPNHYLALFELTLRQPDADAYFLLQDDAILYDGENVRTYLEETLWPGTQLPIVSLYCAEPYTQKQYGWQRLGEVWVWGALAFVFPREVAQAYLRERRVCQHRWRSRSGGLAQIDAVIGWWAQRRHIPIWFPTPSLVQHIGETSTIAADQSAVGVRAASLFVGNRT